MASLDEFSRRIVVRARNVADNADRLVRRVALVADQAVVTATPVDTGRARSNWIVQIGGPATDAIEPYSPGDRGSTGAANVQAALDQGEAAIRDYRAGQEIHITNNLPYIGDLNKGSSAQAPENFVELSVLEAVQAVRFGRIVDGKT